VAFPRRLLGDGEEVVLELHPHWEYMGAPLAVAVAVVAGAIALAVRVEGIPSWGLLGIAAVLVCAVAWLAGRYLRWTTTDLVVTNQRVVLRSGVVARRTQEIPLSRIVDVSVTQTVPQRLAGSGTLLIDSGGEALQGVFVHVPSPASVQSAIHGQMEIRSAAGLSAREALSVPEQIEKLDDLRRRGVISPVEFELEKARLLGRH
jgi:uncharacterized membrane protein YdbT with pleckstrin-like domain